MLCQLSLQFITKFRSINANESGLYMRFVPCPSVSDPTPCHMQTSIVHWSAGSELNAKISAVEYIEKLKVLSCFHRMQEGEYGGGIYVMFNFFFFIALR